MRKLHSECDFKQLSSGNYVAVTPCRPRLSLDDANEDISSGIASVCCNPICSSKPSVIDKYSRVFFPLSFFGSNILYWVTYMNVSSTNDDGLDIVPMGDWTVNEINDHREWVTLFVGVRCRMIHAVRELGAYTVWVRVWWWRIICTDINIYQTFLLCLCQADLIVALFDFFVHIIKLLNFAVLNALLLKHQLYWCPLNLHFMKARSHYYDDLQCFIYLLICIWQATVKMAN